MPQDWREIEQGIVAERIVADPYDGVRTLYARFEDVLENECCLRIVGDLGTMNVEIRVPLEILVKNGWTPPEKSLEERIKATRERLDEAIEMSERLVRQKSRRSTSDVIAGDIADVIRKRTGEDVEIVTFRPRSAPEDNETSEPLGPTPDEQPR